MNHSERTRCELDSLLANTDGEESNLEQHPSEDVSPAPQEVRQVSDTGAQLEVLEEPYVSKCSGALWFLSDVPGSVVGLPATTGEEVIASNCSKCGLSRRGLGEGWVKDVWIWTAALKEAGIVHMKKEPPLQALARAWVALLKERMGKG